MRFLFRRLGELDAEKHPYVAAFFMLLGSIEGRIAGTFLHKAFLIFVPGNDCLMEEEAE